MTAHSNIERRRLKYAATINDETLSEQTDADYELQYVDISNVDSLGKIRTIATYPFADAPTRARRRVRDGDVIISCVRTYLQAIAPIEAPPDNLIVSTGFAVVRPSADVLDAAFSRYALREPSFLAEVEMRSVGVSYPALNASDLGDIPVHLPPEPHQRAIADYLNREMARLDALVAAKERALALLAEKSRALITRAVTRGLDPCVPLRDSGIPWLGKMPAHWAVTRLKFVARVRTGIALGKRFGNKLVREYPYLRVANVQDGHLDLSDVKSISVPDDEARLYHLRAGDVLMNEGGDADKLGRGAIWTGQISPCLHQNHVFAVRPRRLSPAWLNSWISSDVAKAYFESRAKQSTNLASISTSNLNEMPLLKPPDQEQKTIVDYVTRYTARIDNVRKATERTTALLKERRAALIAAAVTGRVNVDYAV